MAEGAPLLRAYRVKPIEGSNPSLSAIFHTPFNKLHNGHKKNTSHLSLIMQKVINMDLNSQEFQNKFEEGENGLSKESKEVLYKLIERASATAGPKEENLMFVPAALVTVFAWETEGKAFDIEDVYKAFQSQAHFDAIFRSNWYTSRMKNIQDRLDSWASFNQKL